MRLIVSVFSILLLVTAVQSDKRKSTMNSLESLINAENDFARLSRETNTKHAFLSAFASDGLIFPGERVNAIEHWKAQPDQKPEERDWLAWEPFYADVAQSGDLGYTSGPYVYKGDRSDTATSHHGYFFSVWKKEKGIWKNWVDMGLGTPFDPADTVAHFDRHATYTPSKMISSITIADAEAAFIDEQNKTGLPAFEKHLGQLCQVNRPRMRPAFGPADAMKSILERAPKIRYHVVETKASQSGEFAVAYGTADITISNGAENPDFNGHYVRVWKVYNGEWKIDVDVMIAFPK